MKNLSMFDRSIIPLLLIAVSLFSSSCEEGNSGKLDILVLEPEDGSKFPVRTTIDIVAQELSPGELYNYNVMLYINDSLIDNAGYIVDDSSYRYRWNTSELEPGKYQFRVNYFYTFWQDDLINESQEGSTEFELELLPWDGVTGSVSDVEGNTYKTVKLGDQWWMAENLTTKKLNDGTGIKHRTEYSEWLTYETTPAYTWPENDEMDLGKTYGALYNWFTVTTGKLCPEGWHVPGDEEWMELEAFLGMTEDELDNTTARIGNQGARLSYNSELWRYSGNASDPEFGTSGFDALPAGYNNYGAFYPTGSSTVFWTSTDSDEDKYAMGRSILRTEEIIYRYAVYKYNAVSVRCIKD